MNLANWQLLHVAKYPFILTIEFLYGLSKKLVFVLVASALTGTHRHSQPRYSLYCSIVRDTEALISCGQIISADLPLLTDGCMHACTDTQLYFSIMMCTMFMCTGIVSSISCMLCIHMHHK